MNSDRERLIEGTLREVLARSPPSISAVYDSSAHPVRFLPKRRYHLSVYNRPGGLEI
jgi:hypothetical protein